MRRPEWASGEKTIEGVPRVRLATPLAPGLTRLRSARRTTASGSPPVRRRALGATVNRRRMDGRGRTFQVTTVISGDGGVRTNSLSPGQEMLLGAMIAAIAVVWSIGLIAYTFIFNYLD